MPAATLDDGEQAGGTGPMGSEVEVKEFTGRRYEQLRTFGANRLAVGGLCVVLFFLLFCFVGPVFYHTNQISTRLFRVNLAPGPGHWLGTDNAGFDELGRLMAGGQTTLAVGLGAALLATAVGAVWGATAGLVGGWVDGLMMRMVDTVMALPVLLLLLFLASVFQPSVPLLVLVVASVAWLVPARLVRAEVLSLRTYPYVEASRCFGGTVSWILGRHLIPNALGTIVVNATFQVADAVLVVASLSFLGLGVAPPAANWGGMVSTGVDYVFSGYWWEIVPAGVCIVALVVAINFIGDGLRDVADVRLTRR